LSPKRRALILCIKAIAVQTALTLAFRLSAGPKTALLVIGLIWLFISLAIGIGGGTHKSYFGNAQYCLCNFRFACI
jgi:hypothetical protein